MFKIMKLKKYNNQPLYGKYYWSEKFDGMRCLITDTGALSSYGNKIHAPDWWINPLIEIVKYRGCYLDGELWAGRGGFQQVMKTCRAKAYRDWKPIMFKQFDWVKSSDALGIEGFDEDIRFYDLPIWNELVDNDIDTPLNNILSVGGEGIVIRSKYQRWINRRIGYKIKNILEGTGIITGVNPGKGKHLGRMGSLTIKTTPDENLNAVTVNISGFTDRERQLIWAIGSKIDFRYRELTNDGIPKEARYIRGF